MKNLLSSVDTLREREGLSHEVHKTLEDYVRRIKQGDTPLMTLAQSDGEV